MDKRIPWKYQFRHFQVFWWKFAKLLMSFSEPKSVFLQILSASSVSRKITTLYFFRSNVYNFAREGPMKVQIFETFECLDQNSPNSCHFWNKKLVFLQIWHHSSVSWDITPLHFSSWNFIYFQQKQSIKVKICWISPEQSKIWNCALSWVTFVKII